MLFLLFHPVVNIIIIVLPKLFVESLIAKKKKYLLIDPRAGRIKTASLAERP